MLGPSLAPTERVPARIVSRGCCRRAYLRGAFIGCGSLSRPRSAAHLEWRVSSDTAALQLQELAEVEGFALGVHETPRYWLAYAKSRETIRGLLAALGAHGAELRLEEEGVFAWAREEANRLANADAGNLRRQAAAAARHTEAIEQVGGPDALPPELRAVAELRLRLPDATLAELGDAAMPRLTQVGRGLAPAPHRPAGGSLRRLGRIEQGPTRIDCAAAWTDEGKACPFASGSTASAASAATSSAPRRNPAPTSSSWRSTTSRTPRRSRTCSSTTRCWAATRASWRPRATA